MALAQNHIHFLNTGTPAQVEIFVIHFAYVQPEPQVFPPSEYGGSGFPSTHGYTASIFKDYENVQTKFAFIPDDGSATYIFDVLVCPSSFDWHGLTTVADQYDATNPGTAR